LAVLDQDLDRIALAADLEAASHGIQKIADDEVVGLGEGGEGAGLRADIADLERLGGVHRRREYRRGGERRAARERALEHGTPAWRAPALPTSTVPVRAFPIDHGRPPCCAPRGHGRGLLSGRRFDLG
jgi:hypothetical protein